MPLYKDKMLPDWVDPKSASVFDPLYKKATRTIVNMLGLNEPDSALETAAPTPLAPIASVVTTTARRIAPKRAAKELVDVLLGRSSRLAEGQGFKPLTDEAAKRLALFQRSTNSVPPPPARIVMSPHSGFKAPNRNIPRNPGLTKDFQKWRSIRGQNPRYWQDMVINPNRTESLAAANLAKRPANTLESLNKVAKTEGSIQQGTGFKLKTERDLRSLLEGPEKALKAGRMDPETYKQVMRENRQKIADYFDQLKQLDKAKYDEDLERRLMLRMLASGGK